MAEYVALPEHLDLADLQHELTLRTVEVESRVDLAASLDGVVLGAIVESAGRQATVQLGGSAVVEASVDGVGPAPEVGSMVAVALAGSALASSGARLCSAAALGLDCLFPGRSGALVLDPAALQGRAGDPLAPAIGWDDTVLDIDNKSLTNRPDLWSHAGVAREVAAILGVASTNPYAGGLAAVPFRSLIGGVDPAICHRLTLLFIERSGPLPETPLWMRSRLARTGQRALHLYADLTNYVMLAVGQPSHAYDATALHLPLSVRFADGAEGSMPFLDGREVELDRSVGVISDRVGPVAIAGAVGNVATQVFPDSHSIVLELGCFDPRVVRVAVVKKGCRTDAAARFEKGLDTQGVDRGRQILLQLIARLDPDAVVTGGDDVVRAATEPQVVATSLRFLNERLGTELEREDVADRLMPLGFDVAGDDAGLRVTCPTWRSTGDVSIDSDVLEEVARMIGYDHLPPSQPCVRLRSPGAPGARGLHRRLREYLAHQVHAQEVLTYPWATERHLRSTGWSISALIEFEGAPAPDRRFLRPSLLPNLLAIVELNLAHRSVFRLFELGCVYLPSPQHALADPDEELPSQPSRLGAVFVGADAGVVLREATGAVTGLSRAGWFPELVLAPTAARAPHGPDQLVQAAVRLAGSDMGSVGLVGPAAIQAAMAHPVHVAYFELGLDGLVTWPSRSNAYRRLPTHPETIVDVSVVVPNDSTWSDLLAAASDVHPLLRAIDFVDEFRGPGLDSGERSITARLTVAAPDRTLLMAEATAVRDRLVARLGEALGARLRS